MRHLGAVALVVLLGTGVAGCKPSPELQKLCDRYVARQESMGRKGGPTVMKQCLRRTPEQVRCLMSASGRRQRIACTQ